MKKLKEDRSLMKLVCAKGHVVAELVARPEGVTLLVSSVRISDLDVCAARGYSGAGGDGLERLLLDDPLYGSDALTVVCPECDTRFHLLPLALHKQLKAGKKRLLMTAQKDTRRRGY